MRKVPHPHKCVDYWLDRDWNLYRPNYFFFKSKELSYNEFRWKHHHLQRLWVRGIIFLFMSIQDGVCNAYSVIFVWKNLIICFFQWKWISNMRGETNHWIHPGMKVFWFSARIIEGLPIYANVSVNAYQTLEKIISKFILTIPNLFWQ